MMPQPRRKKWIETEKGMLIANMERCLCDGTLSKMKTREKKYKPIALYVSSIHHARDPLSYPWKWSWKDVSTKVQNMRHQCALMKQKKNGVFRGRRMVQYFVIMLSLYEHETWFIKLHGTSSSIFWNLSHDPLQNPGMENMNNM